MPPDAAAPSDTSPPRSVSIRPGSAILSVLKHLNYKPWHALAEFVDNAVQSYLQNRDALHALHGAGWKLRVDIDVDASQPARIRVVDNAAGIAAQDFPRAFRPAVVPPDRSGLSEFGMGMKSAACWFAPRWQVRTQALGDAVERTVRLDVASIVRDSLEELAIREGPGRAAGHFTEVVLEEPFHLPVGRTVGKIKEHLTDIYRCYLRDGSLVLRVNTQELAYEEPQILRAPFYREPHGAPRDWRKEINLDLGGGQRAHGFAALRQDGKGARAGFALFRRNRLIQGSGDEGWKHHEVFGAPNMYRHQRLFGELHLEGFEVSHTKDGFRWTDEDAFAQLLADDLDGGDLPLLKQAEGHRQRAPRPALQRSASAAVAGAQEDMQANLEDALPPAAEQARADDPPPELENDAPGRPAPLVE
ncbi:ATP-binding protein [Falsiroseomonas tokyonensis]|uniref:ATP-binding protein n=1 Tax=Falsiroseomonas tokyonensis TaxID=430521 RepID=A0ABV7C4N2_9PROT|nr:ATP-binding protein [Falsiroseomonas tokyonensis]